MSEVTQLCYTLTLIAFLDHCLKPYLIRKWLGLSLCAAGITLLFKPGGTYWETRDLFLVPLLVFCAGTTLIIGRRKFQPDE
ncbi:multisubunit Na+/H+ antiporter MnhC subunit [Pseudomonas sp. 2835]